MNSNDYFEMEDCPSICMMSDYEYDGILAYLQWQGISFEKKDILSIGCGNGILEKKIMEKFDVGRFVLTDASEKLLKKAAFNCPHAEFFQFDCNKIKENNILGKQKFDIIYSVGVMQYLTDKVIKTLNSTMCKLLNKNGIIYHASIPDYRRRWLHRLDRAFIWHDYKRALPKYDFVDSYSRWIKPISFESNEYKTVYVTPSFRPERFDVIIKNE